jgi:hypothetical protein
VMDPFREVPTLQMHCFVADPITQQGPGVVVRCPICDGLTVSDSECGEGVVVVVEVAAGVGDVGASGQA